MPGPPKANAPLANHLDDVIGHVTGRRDHGIAPKRLRRNLGSPKTGQNHAKESHPESEMQGQNHEKNDQSQEKNVQNRKIKGQNLETRDLDQESQNLEIGDQDPEIKGTEEVETDLGVINNLKKVLKFCKFSQN